MKLGNKILVAAAALAVAAGVPAYLIAATAAATAAANGPVMQAVSKGKPHDFVYGMSFEGRQGIAVGDHGLILSTGDGGATWQTVPVPEAKGAFFTVLRSAGKCLAGGQEGAILRSDDCKHWQAVAPVTKARILAIHANAQGVGYAVGEFGTLLKTADWGKTWNPLQVDWKALLGNDAEPHLYAVHVEDDGTVSMAGEFELVIRSSDGGGTWAVLHKGQRSLFGLAVSRGGSMFAVGQEGLILKSGDRGKTWSTVPAPTKAVLTDIALSEDGGAAIAVGVRALLVSRDGGASFAADGSPMSTQEMHSTVRVVGDSSGARTVLVGGERGDIFRMTF